MGRGDGMGGMCARAGVVCESFCAALVLVCCVHWYVDPQKLLEGTSGACSRWSEVEQLQVKGNDISSS